MMLRAVKIKSGEYRIGEYVAFREDSPSVGDRTDRWGNITQYEAPSGSRTWGVVLAARYDAMGGDIGLPDALVEFDTLRECISYAQSNTTSPEGNDQHER